MNGLQWVFPIQPDPQGGAFAGVGPRGPAGRAPGRDRSRRFGRDDNGGTRGMIMGLADD